MTWAPDISALVVVDELPRRIHGLYPMLNGAFLVTFTTRSPHEQHRVEV